MSFLWDSLYSVFARTRNNLVNPPGEENSELAITGEGRGATCLTSVYCARYCDMWVMPVRLQLSIRDWMPTEVNAVNVTTTSVTIRCICKASKVIQKNVKIP